MKKNYYITTPIYYPSSYLHLGHTYSTVVADVLKRFKKKQGYDVFFTTGTDEHGQKMKESAEKMGLPIMEYIDSIVKSTKDLWSILDIRYDSFIRSTDPNHEKVVQDVFNKLYEKGAIYKGTYSGWYCVPCESFWTESQLVNGACPDCGREVQQKEEESYFFRLSAYKEKLLKLYDENDKFIMPLSRKNEMINNFLADELEDLSVSRSSVDWGVKVPFDDKHVIYVWIDALMCYLTSLGFGMEDDSNYRKFWPADVHIVGKEITRFHAIIWPAVLMALDVEIPKMIFGHGWILFDEDKMSKSKGNVIYPEPIIDLYGIDALKFFMLREFSFGQDGNFTKEKFLARFNSDLANDLGNLVSRTISMVMKYNDGVLRVGSKENEFDKSLEEMVLSTRARVEKEMEDLNFSLAIEEIWKSIRRTNKYIDETTPWIVDKENDTERLDSILYHLCESIRVIITVLEPFMSYTTDSIMKQIGLEELNWDDAVKWGVIKEGTVVVKEAPMFPRLVIEEEIPRWEEANANLLERRGIKAPKKLEHLPEISIDDFAKIEFRTGKVIECEAHPKADKLLVSKIDIGGEIRQIVSGIKKFYSPEEMIGQNVVVVCNLKPIKLKGVESFGMVLCAADEKDTVLSLVTTLKEMETGSQIR